MRSLSVLSLLLAGALLAVEGCGATPSGNPDGGSTDVRVGEGAKVPDFGARDGLLRHGNAGALCDPATGAGCTGQAVCLRLSAAVGLCAIPDCTVEDMATPVKEDDCPPLPGSSRGTACAPVEVKDGTGTKTVNFCLPQCKASVKENACAAVSEKLTCDPITALLTGYTEVCLVPACSESSQCGKDPVQPGATCNPTTGTCQITGKPGVVVGSPCKLSTDCGPGQFCMAEASDPKTGKVTLAGGYCTVVGCAHNDGVSELWRCPDGSKCFLLGSSQALSLCLAVGCKVGLAPEKDGCRDEAPLGQYTCAELNGQGVCWVDVKTGKP